MEVADGVGRLVDDHVPQQTLQALGMSIHVGLHATVSRFLCLAIYYKSEQNSDRSTIYK